MLTNGFKIVLFFVSITFVVGQPVLDSIIKGTLVECSSFSDEFEENNEDLEEDIDDFSFIVFSSFSMQLTYVFNSSKATESSSQLNLSDGFFQSPFTPPELV